MNSPKISYADTIAAQMDEQLGADFVLVLGTNNECGNDCFVYSERGNEIGVVELANTFMQNPPHMIANGQPLDNSSKWFKACVVLFSVETYIDSPNREKPDQPPEKVKHYGMGVMHDGNPMLITGMVRTYLHQKNMQASLEAAARHNRPMDGGASV